MEMINGHIDTYLYVQWITWNVIVCAVFITYCSSVSLYLGSFCRAESSSTSDCCRLFPLRSSSLRLEGFDLRAEAKDEQLLTVRLQQLRL